MMPTVLLSRRRKVEITSADTIGLLNMIISSGVHIVNVEHCGELTVRFDVLDRDVEKVCVLSGRFGGSVKKLEKKGILWAMTAVKKRPAFVAAVMILLLLFIFLPTRVFFVSVEGNTTIPANKIIEAAADCGIQFGASARQIRSEKMKNALLQKIPQLQWAGINTSGCTAIISVKEKTEPESQHSSANQVSSIVAALDGIIQHCTVYQGNPLCKTGQAVKAGQILVSGYTDCGIYVQATRADAEIRALTSRELQVVTPQNALIRGEMITQKTEYSIRLGKKLIKLTKDSGILGTTCAKIYLEEYVHLPGGFTLPVALVKETTFVYAQADLSTPDDSDDWLYSFAETYLQGQMIAGEIISAQSNLEVVDGSTCLNGRYACIEMIGRVKYEQTILKDETND